MVKHPISSQYNRIFDDTITDVYYTSLYISEQEESRVQLAPVQEEIAAKEGPIAAPGQKVSSKAERLLARSQEEQHKVTHKLAPWVLCALKKMFHFVTYFYVNTT